MIVTLQMQGLHTLEQVRAFMAGNAPVSFTLTDAVSARVWMTEPLRRFGYRTLSRSDKGLLRRYLTKITGLSRAQMTRRIAEFLACGPSRIGAVRPSSRLCDAVRWSTSACWPRWMLPWQRENRAMCWPGISRAAMPMV